MEIELIKTRWIDGMGMDDSATLVERFERVFSVEPDALALAFLDDGERVSVRLTRRELRGQVLSLAARLQREGGFGERALLLFPTGPEFVRAYLACLYAGVVPVPCYPPTRTRPDARIDAIARTAKARFALTTSRVGANDERRLGWYPPLADARWILVDDVDFSGVADWAKPAIGPDTLALIQFTSGSTADPRGVLVTHANLLANLRDLAAHLDHDRHSVMVSWLPLFHDLGLIYGLLQPLAEGHLGVLMPPAAFLQQPLRWLRAISGFRATHAAAPNFAYDLCATRASSNSLDGLDLSTWRVAVNAAEPVRDQTLTRFAERFAPLGFRAEAFCPGFGLAEATLHVTSVAAQRTPARAVVDPQALKAQRVVWASPAESKAVCLVSSGQPVHPTAIRIVDPDTCQPCKPDCVGEIWVGGPTVATGYFDNEEASVAAFGGRIQGDARCYLRTGDLGFLHDGELFVTGRLKDILILHGANHYPQDFESTVEACHPALAPAGSAAFAIDGPLGEGLAVVAELDRATRKRFDPSAIIDAIRAAISRVHGVSVDHVTLIDPHTLPRTTSGKVQRRACRDRLLAGSLMVVACWQRGQDHAALSPPLEQTPTQLLAWLCQRFAQRLEVDIKRIDPNVSWDRLGLDSVGAMELSGELSRYLGRPIEPTVLYDHPSPRALVAHLASTNPAQLVSDPILLKTTPMREVQGRDVAIIGMACRFPAADSPEAFWQLLVEGRCAVGILPAERQGDGSMVDGIDDPVGRRGGFLSGIDQFDSAFFGISPREAERMDPQQRILLELAWEALERASIPPHSMAGSRAGVFIGASNSDYLRLLLAQGLAREPYLGTGSALSVLANRISYALDLKGPSITVDTACSSSLVGIAMACQSLRLGESDLALAGGVNLVLTPEITLGFAASGMLAPDGLCKAFAANADGYVRSEGAGLLVLKRLADAQRDGDEVLAVIHGVAVGQDGRSAGLTAPNGPAQQAVVRAALQDAGVPPVAIGYVEAHGTGTALGDPIEVKALATVLREGRHAGMACLVGSVKSNIGHLESAAGVAGVIKAVLSLQHGLVPASLHCEEVSPRLELGGVLQVANRPCSWPAGAVARKAGVSSFGFGGTNAHVVLGEAPPPAASPRSDTHDTAHAMTQVLALSARDPAALRALAVGAASVLQGADAATLRAACLESQLARSALPERLGLVADGPAAASKVLADWARGQEPAPGTLLAHGRSEPGEEPRIAFLFTGQGLQVPGMGRELYEREPVFREAIAACDAVLGHSLGAPLAHLLYADEPAPLDDMRITQPALFALQYALVRLWESWGIRPDAVLGHSLGEFAAACAAGALDLQLALGLVTARGRLLQSVQAEGLMVATTAPEPLLAQVMARWPGQLSLAADNGPGHLVFAGERIAAQAAAEMLAAHGAKCTPLAIAQASHSPLVDPILDAFAAEAASLARVSPPREPRVPLVSNVTGTWMARAPGPDDWLSHLRSPVRFAQGLQALVDAGYRQFVEIGPHPALLTLAASQHDSPAFGWHASLHRQRGALQQMLFSAAALWARGVPLDWRARSGAARPARQVLPTYPFQRQRHWLPAGPGGGPVSAVTPRPASGTALPGLQVEVASAEIARVFNAQLHGVPPGAAHRLLGSDFLSAPVVLAALVEAARRDPALADAPALRLDNLAWHTPLALDAGRTLQTQLVCRPLADGLGLALHSWDAGQGSWRQHLQARIGWKQPAISPGSAAQPWEGRDIPPSEFYGSLRACGLDLTGHELLDRIELGEGCARVAAGPPVGRQGLLPRLCEIALQAAAAALGPNGSLRMLSSMAHAVLPAQLGPVGLQALARRNGAADAVDVQVLDVAGQPVARFECLTFLPVSAAAGTRYTLRWEPAPIGPLPTLPARSWLVVEGTEGGGLALAERLRGAGALAQVFRLADAEDVRAGLDAAAARLGQSPQGVICLAPGEGQVAIALAQALLQLAWPARLWLVTTGATPAGGGGRLEHALQAGAWGVGRCLALEHAALWGGIIDCESPEADARAAAVSAVLAQWQAPHDQVAWRSGRALVPCLQPLPAADQAPAPLRTDATYLVTGGAGALGLALAAALVEGGARSLVLVGRSPTPSAPQRAQIDRLRARGAQLRYLCLDVSKPQEVVDGICALAAGPLPLRGVLHAAGVPGRCRVRDMQPQAFERVFAAKARGAMALAQATRELPLDFFICVGSMVSAWGAGEQAHYAAANAVADAVAAALAASGRPAVSLALGPLQGGMLSAELAAAMQVLGVSSASLVGAAGAVLARRHSSASVQVLAQVDWERFAPVLEPSGPRGFLDAVRPSAAPARSDRAGLPADLAGADAGQIEHYLRERVLAQASKVLGVAAGDWGELRRGFFERGMDSITALELRRRIEREFGLALPATTVFDHPSVLALANALAARLAPVQPRPSQPLQTTAGDPMTAALARLERLVQEP
jgi:acyl transferase domain-containing protein/acyl-CoA synthetase (AMP-forming)/AMP-acid ligase II/acyl carrier protein